MNDIAVTFFASFLIWFMIGGIFILWIVDGLIKKEVALHTTLSGMAAWVLAEMTKSLLPTQRPFVIGGTEPLTVTTPADGAFPSTHSTVAFAAAVAIFLHDKKLGTIYLISAFFVALGRVLGNVHFVIDVVGGAVLGTIIAIVFDRVHVTKIIRKEY